MKAHTRGDFRQKNRNVFSTFANYVSESVGFRNSKLYKVPKH